MSQDDEKRRCYVCGRNQLDDTQRQTCTGCLGSTRQALIEIERLYALLPAELVGRIGAAAPMDPSGARGSEQPMPGGEVLVLMAPGSTGRAAATASLHGMDDSHAADDLDTDTPAVLASLATWEDDWRVVRGEPGAGKATIMSVVTALTRRITWASQHHDAFDVFVTEVRRLQHALRRAIRDNDPVDRGVACLNHECGGQIQRHYAPANPCGCVTPQREYQSACAARYRNVTNPGEHGACTHDLNDPDHWPTGNEPYDQYRARLDAHWAQHTTHNQGGQHENWQCSNPACRRVYSPEDYNRAVAQSWEEDKRRKAADQEAS